MALSQPHLLFGVDKFRKMRTQLGNQLIDIEFFKAAPGQDSRPAKNPRNIATSKQC